ncbi:MAG: hypothetical protein KGN02_07305 [bacterium]|nr:hypothetical protein [bacterium]
MLLALLVALGALTLHRGTHAVPSGGSGVRTSVSNTFTGPQRFDALTSIRSNGVGAALDHGLHLTNVAPSASVPSVVAMVGAYAPRIDSACNEEQAVSQEWDGVAGAHAANYGGYRVFWTKADGSCSGSEVLVLTAGQHLFPAGPPIAAARSTSGCAGTDSQGMCRIATPTTCAASVPCGSVTIVFGTPFYQPDGKTTEPPFCFYTAQDADIKNNVWVPVPQVMAYDRIAVGYAPLVAQRTGRTVELYWRCNASGY